MHCVLQTTALAIAILLGTTIGAAAASADMCLNAIASAERQDRALPTGLMRSIALVESGYRHKSSGRWVPWPWTINSPAGSFYLGSRREAVAKVEELKRQGITNIDVGCMQVNLHHHPKAFRSLDEAFRPESNVAYAATFLRQLMASNRLFHAVGRYHSSTPQRRDSYARKVYARWGKDVGIAGAEEIPSKHGLGKPDSRRIMVRANPAPAAPSNSRVWQGVYGDRSSETQLVDNAGHGSWLQGSESLAPTMPRNAGQITFR